MLKKDEFTLQSWGFVTSKRRALIQRKRKRRDNDKNTWILDIFYFLYTAPLKKYKEKILSNPKAGKDFFD
ncbi:MAG TPA: hypothetical protein DHW42_08495 [Candidatus Marinimicrobia bacterium]|nr:hypothetical protein [Candidatus Neomarinimicrobiota bacterium]